MNKTLSKILAVMIAATALTTSVPITELCVSAASTTSEVSHTTTMYVKSKTYAYKTASKTSKKMKKLNKGDSIKVVGTSGSYYKLSNNTYVLKSKVSKKLTTWTETKYSKAITRYVKANSTKTRAKALTNGKVVKTLKAGTKLTIVATTNTGFYKLKDGSFIATSAVSKTKPKANSSTVYYDAGTMLLNGYYDGKTGNLDTNKYETNWQTTNVVSYVTDSDVTLPSTTNINKASSKPMMSWEDYKNNTQLPDYGAPGAKFGREDSNGDGEINNMDSAMIYNYIAKGTAKTQNGKTTVEWEIKAWRAWDDEKNEYNFVTKDSLNNYDAIEKEWNSGKLFEANAPVWASGNTNWDDWSDPSSTHGNNYLEWGYDSNNPANSLYWSTITTYPHDTTAGATTQLDEGIYTTLTLPNSTGTAFGLYTTNALDQNGNFVLKPTTGMMPDSAFGANWQTKLGTDLALHSELNKGVFSYIYTDCVCGGKDADTTCTCKWEDLAVTSFPAYDTPHMIQKMWYYSIKRMKTVPMFSDVSGVRLYDIWADVFFLHPTEGSVTSVYNNLLGNDLHFNFNGNGNTVSLTSDMAAVMIGTELYDAYATINDHKIPVDSANQTDPKYMNTEGMSMIGLNLKYDITYDYCRAGGTITGTIK